MSIDTAVTWTCATGRCSDSATSAAAAAASTSSPASAPSALASRAARAWRQRVVESSARTASTHLMCSTWASLSSSSSFSYASSAVAASPAVLLLGDGGASLSHCRS
ncbi:hypothetical protein NESM_000904600 [Novymonas esmeraldas]|uniref:Uncharacterized protein n=1 Tax=Novymonas esmeraldas TaxID=1808958 RepID=A0AAW0EYA6_9TRYP